MWGRSLMGDIVHVDEERGYFLAALAAELQRQDLKWGEQNHPSYPSFKNEQARDIPYLLKVLHNDPARRCWTYVSITEADAKLNCEDDVRNDDVNWAAILHEEIAEAYSADIDSDHHIEELVQVAAVALQWAASIKRNRK